MKTRVYACILTVLALALSLVLFGCNSGNNSNPSDAEAEPVVLLEEDSLQSTLSIGDHVLFGGYEQWSAHEGPEWIEWRVLDIDGDRALLISMYALDALPFNTLQFDDEGAPIKPENEWETSDLRAWLNDDFANSAFTSEEKARIDGEVFCLSAGEAEQYFSSEDDRICYASEYAEYRDIGVTGSPEDGIGCRWWLRTSADDISVATVGWHGYVEPDGWPSDSDGIAVRPAVWVHLDGEGYSESSTNGNATETPEVDISGDWVLYEIVGNADVSASPEDVASLVDSGMYVTMSLDEHWNGTIDIFGETHDLTWEPDGSGYIITVEGDPAPASLRDDGMLVVDAGDGSGLVFQRLTGELPAPATPTQSNLPDGAIYWYEADQHVGEIVSVYGDVKSTEFAYESNGQPTFIDIGASYPDSSRVTVVIWGEYRGNFPAPPEEMYAGQTILAAGEIYVHDGVCNIEVHSPEQISVV